MPQHLPVRQSQLVQHAGLLIGDRLGGRVELYFLSQHLLQYRPLSACQCLHERGADQVGLRRWPGCRLADRGSSSEA